MRIWWKQADLLIVIALLVGVFAYRHGTEAWAHVGPRLANISEHVATRFAAIEASDETDFAEKIAAGTTEPTPIPQAGDIDALPATPGSRAEEVIPPHGRRRILVPVCPSGYGHGCSY